MRHDPSPPAATCKGRAANNSGDARAEFEGVEEERPLVRNPGTRDKGQGTWEGDLYQKPPTPHTRTTPRYTHSLADLYASFGRRWFNAFIVESLSLFSHPRDGNLEHQLLHARGACTPLHISPVPSAALSSDLHVTVSFLVNAFLACLPSCSVQAGYVGCTMQSNVPYKEYVVRPGPY